MADKEEKSGEDDGNTVAKVTFVLTMLLSIGFVGSIFVFILR